MTQTSVAKFYQKQGQKLIDVANYPAAIKNHLILEKQTLGKIILTHGYDGIVEVGCMDGSMHYEDLLACPIHYFGIDIVENSIKAINSKIALDLHPFHRSAHYLDICNLSELSFKINSLCKNVLVIFPFNCFGNLKNPIQALKEISICGYDLLILTYATHEKSNKIREAYYQNCDYPQLEHVIDTQGTLFTSADGLHTYAYHKHQLQNWLTQEGYSCVISPYGQLGMSYLGLKLES